VECRPFNCNDVPLGLVNTPQTTQRSKKERENLLPVSGVCVCVPRGAEAGRSRHAAPALHPRRVSRGKPRGDLISQRVVVWYTNAGENLNCMPSTLPIGFCLLQLAPTKLSSCSCPKGTNHLLFGISRSRALPVRAIESAARLRDQFRLSSLVQLEYSRLLV
jgi:hypothetical protein